MFICYSKNVNLGVHEFFHKKIICFVKSYYYYKKLYFRKWLKIYMFKEYMIVFMNVNTCLYVAVKM